MKGKSKMSKDESVRIHLPADRESQVPGICSSLLLVIMSTFTLTSCEGFKILTLHNKTASTINIETRPELPRFRQPSPADTTTILLPSKTYQVLPDSSISILIKFTGLVFNKKISEKDLSIDYLKIETGTDTIVANNRGEIIKLISDPRLKYQIKDKSFSSDNNKNIEAIVVRP